MDTDFPEVGKIQQDFLKEHVFPSTGAQRAEVVQGPGYGVDTSVVRLNEAMALVTATDPVSLIPTLGFQESAWLSVHLVASDLATAGCLPQYAQFCLNLPPDLSTEDFQTYWSWISHYCEELGTAITGGHTGRIAGQNSTIAGGATMMSYVSYDTVLTANKALPGDKLILVKESALISTAILALSFPETILKNCGKEVLEMGQALFEQTSAVMAALAAADYGLHHAGVRAMHDITECGVLGAVVEMMSSARCGVEVQHHAIPQGAAQAAICHHFGIDPLYAVGAGALLLSVAPDHAEGVISHLETKGYAAKVIGSVLPPEAGMRLIIEELQQPLAHPGVDPYWPAFFNALNNGWK